MNENQALGFDDVSEEWSPPKEERKLYVPKLRRKKVKIWHVDEALYEHHNGFSIRAYFISQYEFKNENGVMGFLVDFLEKNEYGQRKTPGLFWCPSAIARSGELMSAGPHYCHRVNGKSLIKVSKKEVK